MDNSLIKSEDNGLKKTEYDAFEPTAKILAANALSQSLSFCMERKYLEDIDKGNHCFEICSKERTDSPLDPYWIEIKQIGKPLNENVENCFTAIQKILHSCFLPHKTQLLFLVHSNNGICHLYLGIRPIDSTAIKPSFITSLNNFIKGIWPGLQCEEIQDENKMDFLKDKLSDGEDSYNCIYSLTGIPSMESQYKSTYPATIDKLLAGMNDKDFSYLVIADPIQENEIDSILYKCRDMNGQAESLKSFNFSESSGSSYSEAKTISESADGELLGGLRAGLSLASAIPPPVGLVAMVGNLGLSLLSPPKTKSETKTLSINNSKSISKNLVNKHIEAISEHLVSHSKRFETGKAIGCWNVGVYLMAKKESAIQGASLQLRSILSGQESIFEPIRIHNITKDVEKDKHNTLACFEAPSIYIEAQKRRFEHPLGNYFNELKSVLTTKELSYLINFPLRSVPGISVIDSSPEFSLNQPKENKNEKTVDLGKLLYGGSDTSMEYKIPIDSLSKHTLLSGINGSGKTNTVQAILNSLKNELPYLIIEPAKTEYVDWAIEHNKNNPETPVLIYIPGCKTFKSKAHPEGYKLENRLKLNPFEIVWLDKEQEPNVLAHIDRLKSTFAAAFPMYDILPVLMEDLIYTIYQNKSTNWLTQQPEYGKTIPPTLNAMSTYVDKVIENRGYEERIGQNMKACLNTRIDSLKRGWKGELLNTIHSIDWKELFEKRCIINLSYVGDDVDKAFFMALILQFLYEYRTACAELGRTDFNDNSCKHLTVIEEAHRVMANCANPEMPQYKSAMMFSNMLSEIRAYGEGLLLVDQVPTRLIPDAIKNTNLKITHRLVAEDDCKAIGESMGLSEEQRKVIPKLMTGQCIVSGSLSPETYWIKVNKVK